MQQIDLHVHTRLSKTFEFEPTTVKKLKDTGARRGLTGFALTEHIHAVDFWPMHQHLMREYPYRDGIYDLGDGFEMFSGCEITVAERIDFIVIGDLTEIQRLDDAFSPRPSEDHYIPGVAFLHEARRRNLIVIAAHPFRPGKETNKLPLELVFGHVNAIEVNGRDYGTEVRLSALAHEYNMPVSGGSDAHHPFQAGIRSTVFSDGELSLASIARAFEERKTHVHCKPYAPAVVETCKAIKRMAKLRRGEFPEAEHLDARTERVPPIAAAL